MQASTWPASVRCASSYLLRGGRAYDSNVTRTKDRVAIIPEHHHARLNEWPVCVLERCRHRLGPSLTRPLRSKQARAELLAFYVIAATVCVAVIFLSILSLRMSSRQPTYCLLPSGGCDSLDFFRNARGCKMVSLVSLVTAARVMERESNGRSF